MRNTNAEELRITRNGYARIVGVDTFVDRNNETEPEAITEKVLLSTDDLFRRMTRDTKSQSETNKLILPKNCRFHWDLGNSKNMFVIEEDPAIRTIKVEYYLGRELETIKMQGKLEDYGLTELYSNQPTGPVEFTVAFPYLIYVVATDGSRLSACQVYYRNRPINSLNDYLCRANLFNLSSSRYLCTGSDIEMDFTNRGPAKAIEHTLSQFWFNIFNTDYTHGPDAYKHTPELATMFDWMYITQMDPMFVYRNDLWIKESNNLHEAVIEVKDNLRSSDRSNNFCWEKMERMFNVSSSETEVRDDGTAVKYDESCREIYVTFKDGDVDNNVMLEVGSPVRYDDKDYFFYSFMHDAYDGDLAKIQLYDADQNIIELDATRELKLILAENVYLGGGDELNQIELENGEILLKDEIIKAGGRYTKIARFRMSIEGKRQIKFERGAWHYFDTLINVEKVEVTKIVIRDVEVNEGDDFYITNESSYNGMPAHRIQQVRFNGMIPTSSGDRLICLFKSPSGHTTKISPEQIECNEVMLTPPTPESLGEDFKLLHTGSCVYTNDNENQTEKLYLKRGIGIMHVSNTSDSSYYAPPLSQNERYIWENVLSQDQTRFHIPGIDFDIDYSIGDTVVYAPHWSDTEDSPVSDNFVIRTVTGFVKNESNYKISICLSDPTEALAPSIEGPVREKPSKNVLLMDCNNSRIMAYGSLRKITSVCGVLKAGDKFKSKSRVPAFPQKESHQIVGFLNDTGAEPLLLASNGLTLHVNEQLMENFEFMPIGTTKWNKCEIAPVVDMQELRVQCGDVFKYSSNAYICLFDGYKDKSGARVRDYIMDSNMSHIGYFTRSSGSVAYIGFPVPRLTQQGEIDALQHGYPTGHGTKVLTNNRRHRYYA